LPAQGTGNGWRSARALRDYLEPGSTRPAGPLTNLRKGVRHIPALPRRKQVKHMPAFLAGANAAHA